LAVVPIPQDIELVSIGLVAIELVAGVPDRSSCRTCSVAVEVIGVDIVAAVGPLWVKYHSCDHIAKCVVIRPIAIVLIATFTSNP